MLFLPVFIYGLINLKKKIDGPLNFISCEILHDFFNHQLLILLIGWNTYIYLSEEKKIWANNYKQLQSEWNFLEI